MSKSMLLSTVLLAGCGIVSAQTFSVIHYFGSQPGDPDNAYGIIAQSRGGAMITTSPDNFSDNIGKAFRISTGGSLEVLHQFANAEGLLPFSGLTLARDGYYYGTTKTGGVYGLGTIFKMSADGTVNKLYDFTGGSDGENPESAPIESAEGDLYGTSLGSLPHYGAVYKITKDGNFTLLHAFNDADGRNAFGQLVQGTDNYFYGTTMDGGAHNNGTIFRINRSGDFKVLWNFWSTKGAKPSHGVIQANDGNFYGVTRQGGSSHLGVLFRMKPDGTVTVLHTFTGATDGGNPVGALLQGTDGNLYGTNTIGGQANGDGFGVLFRSTLAGALVPLYAFNVQSGADSYGPLLQHTNGKIYGETTDGGAFGKGGFFRLDAGLRPFVTYLHTYGRAGAVVQILGQGFTDTNEVFFNGTPATFKLVYPTFIKATVPDGATTGPITVTTANGTLTSNKIFIVHPK